MARTVQARLDQRAEEDLALLRNEGHNDSDAIRLALREAAERGGGAAHCASRRKPPARTPTTSRTHVACAPKWTLSRPPGPSPEHVVRGEVFRLRSPRSQRASRATRRPARGHRPSRRTARPQHRARRAHLAIGAPTILPTHHRSGRTNHTRTRRANDRDHTRPARQLTRPPQRERAPRPRHAPSRSSSASDTRRRSRRRRATADTRPTARPTINRRLVDVPSP